MKTSKALKLVVQCGPGFKLALRTGEEGLGCLSPVCGECPFRIVKTESLRQPVAAVFQLTLLSARSQVARSQSVTDSV